MKDYTVHAIERKDAIPWIKLKHYAKRIPSNVFRCFGLFLNDEMFGVIVYGLSGNKNLNSLGCFKCIELQRLVVDDSLKKNTTSWFISKSFKLLNRPIVLVSYADEAQNHFGYIYQATNWIYTGVTDSKTIFRNKDFEYHNKSFSDKYGNSSRKFAESIGFEVVKTKPKHRYYYFLGSKKQKKQMLADLKYPILPYPKGESKKYDVSATFPKQVQLF